MRSGPIEEAEGLDAMAGAATKDAVDKLVGYGDMELV